MDKTVVELFAGVGGFRLGLQKNFEVVWGNQWEPGKKNQYAFDCYSSRFESGQHVNEDISKVDLADMPEHTVLVGGFPCQDYSVARTGAQGIAGKKGVLFWEIKRILEEKRPPFVLLENVDRLLKSPTTQRGRDFAVMLKTFDDLGYTVEWRVINAADYGHAQKRRRVFIFATQKHTKFAQSYIEENLKMAIHKNGFFVDRFPIQEKEHEKHFPLEAVFEGDVLDVSENFTLLFRNSGVMKNGKIYTEEITPKNESPTSLTDILEVDVAEKYYLNEETFASWKYLKGAKAIERTSKSGHSYTYSEGTMAFPDDLNSPGRTILTSEGTKNRSSHVVKDPQTGRLRILTPVECERLNGFPDNWTDTGMTERMRYFCMGNALVVDLIKKMGDTLHSIIGKEQ